MINSAITMINAQPLNSQEEAANVWIWGTTFVADAMEVCLAQIDAIEVCLDDFIRLENAWSVVQSAVGASIGAIKGIFNLMAPCEAPEAQQHRSEATEGTVRSMLRRMSTAMTSGMNSAAPSRRQSVISINNPMPASLQHGSVQTGPPFRGVGWRPSALKHSKGPMELMPTIPPTPAAALLNSNPFDNSFTSNDQNFSVGEDVPPPPTAPTQHFPPTSSGPSSLQQPSSGVMAPGIYSPAASNTNTFSTATTPAFSNTGTPAASNNGDGSGSPGSAASVGGSGKTRPRSANVQGQQPLFDSDWNSLMQNDPLSEDATMSGTDMGGEDGGLGLNNGFFRRLSSAFAPTAVH
ncbi:hypothetical protein B0J12DRAFT_784785 [Macrophomina phaseolina]|uniref:Uncharacterized protein n=1 Tax=Macrophomina phaseolina TaxID=35725 RepID=A0ABQ8GE31_9PEZI|nr:hypothetical protein B0J12DRAFT_784785 [Macrophomina phaseolina]